MEGREAISRHIRSRKEEQPAWERQERGRRGGHCEARKSSTQLQKQSRERI